MFNVLIVSIANGSLSGGSVASRSNFEALRDAIDCKMAVIGPQDLDYATDRYMPAPSSIGKMLCYARLRPAIDYGAVLETVCGATVSSPDLIFIDSSLLGPIVPSLRKCYPKAQIATFFHNVESTAYFSVMARANPASWLRLLSMYRAERTAATGSDYRIALSNSDSRLLKRMFGVESDAIWPITYPAADLVPCRREILEDYVLFVGGYYKPNLEAIAYLASRIAPYVKKKIVVAGFDLYKIQSQYANHSNLIVLSSPPSLASLYQYANLVVAPIFSGGGVKTKIIEALSYGRAVVASSEAANGFENISSRALHIATSDTDYINAINAASTIEADLEIVAEFESYFSVKAKVALVRNLISGIKKQAGARLKQFA
jgi:glycosyltransferase involved in cell wall biosynthesis